VAAWENQLAKLSVSVAVRHRLASRTQLGPRTGSNAGLAQRNCDSIVSFLFHSCFILVSFLFHSV
jgi:hypothetical protein